MAETFLPLIVTLFLITFLINSACALSIFDNSHSNESKLWKLKVSNTNSTTPWPQIGFDAMQTYYLPYTLQQAEFVANLSIQTPFEENPPAKTMIFHDSLGKFILPIQGAESKFNHIPLIYLVGFNLIDAKNGRTERAPFQLEAKRYSIEESILMDSKGFLIVLVYDNVKYQTCLLKINTFNWSQYSITPLTFNSYNVRAALAENSNCLVYLAETWIGCIDLDNPKSLKWNQTLSDVPSGHTQMFITETNHIYLSLMYSIMKISVSNGKFTIAKLGMPISSIGYTGKDSLLSFSYIPSPGSHKSYFGVIDIESGIFNSIEFPGSLIELTVSYTYTQVEMASSYAFKTVVITRNIETGDRTLVLYNTLVSNNGKISKPLAQVGNDLKVFGPIPRAILAKDASKFVYYINGKYAIFNVKSGQIEKFVSSKLPAGFNVQIFTAYNGKVYSLISYNSVNLAFEAIDLQ